MALDTIIMNGDTVIFNPIFGAATVDIRPGSIQASGKTTINGENVCVLGDEKKVVVTNCTYIIPGFNQKGMGNLKITSLNTNQLTQKSKSSQKPMLLQGIMFEAHFEVRLPAQQIIPGSAPVADPLKIYKGTGQLKSKNQKNKAT